MKSTKPLCALLVIALSFVWYNPSLAEPPAGSENPFSIELGMTYRYFDYKEDLNAPQKSTESGWLPGAYLNAAFLKKSVFYSKIHVDYAAADITYDGSTQNGRPISFSDSAAKLFKFEWDVGYPVAIGKSFILTPYVGYGYRYWSRGDSRYIPQLNVLTIKEEYYWHYIPVGIKLDYDISDRWTIGASASANFMFNGNMKAHSSEVMTGLNDLDFSLGNKVGFYAEVPVTFRFTKHWALVLTPWYEYSAFGQSDTVYMTTFAGNVIGRAYEPASKTNQYGANLGANFSF